VPPLQHRYSSCTLWSICTFVEVSFYHTMKHKLHSLQLLATCTHVELWLIHAICVVSQGCVFCQILSPYSYAPWARAALSRIPLQSCKMYGGMLKIVLQPSRSTDSPLEIVVYISGSRGSYRASLLLLLWSWFLSTFLFSSTMSHNRSNQQSCRIVNLVEYSPGYRQSLMWRVAWHHICGIW